MLRAKRETSGKKVLFLHIQKTAGTSIVDIARQTYGQDIVSHGDYSTLSLDELSQIRFVSGHFGYDFARRLMTDRYTFTFLREPKERVLSLYHYCRGLPAAESHMAKLANSSNLEEFILSSKSDSIARVHIWNNQTWQLGIGFGRFDGRSIYDIEAGNLLAIAKKNLDEFSFIGLTEEFDTDRDKILKEINLPCPRGALRSNVGSPRKALEELPSSTRALLDEVTSLDTSLYEEAKALRAKRRC